MRRQGVRDINFSNDGRRFLSSSYDKVVKLWDTETGQVITSLGEGKMFFAAKFHPDDSKQNVVMGGCQDKKVYQWDSNTGDLVQARRCTRLPCKFTPQVQKQDSGVCGHSSLPGVGLQVSGGCLASSSYAGGGSAAATDASSCACLRLDSGAEQWRNILHAHLVLSQTNRSMTTTWRRSTR